MDIKGRTVAIIGELGYVFNIYVEYYGTYHMIVLKETDPNKDFALKVYKHAENKRTVVTITQNGRTMLFHPEEEKMFIGKIKEIRPMDRQQIKRIEEINKRKKKVQEFHELLNSIGISFNIDLYPYREDADGMEVYHDGEIVFRGTTEDLDSKNYKEKK